MAARAKGAAPEAADCDATATVHSNGRVGKLKAAALAAAAAPVPRHNGAAARHAAAVVRTPMGLALQRNDLVRVMLQALRGLGLAGAAEALEAEAGVCLEPATASGFRGAVLGGRWSEASSLVPALGLGSAAAEAKARDLLLEQEYLELLEAGRAGEATALLRRHVAAGGLPGREGAAGVERLTGLLLCAGGAQLRQEAKWDGAGGQSRALLLGRVQALAPTSLFMPPDRLLRLVDQAAALQAARCHGYGGPGALARWPRGPAPLLQDLRCEGGELPSRELAVLEQHRDEVLFVAFSPDGRRLASASKDGTVAVWRTDVFPPALLHVLEIRAGQHGQHDPEYAECRRRAAASAAGASLQAVARRAGSWRRRGRPAGAGSVEYGDADEEDEEDEDGVDDDNDDDDDDDDVDVDDVDEDEDEDGDGIEDGGNHDEQEASHADGSVKRRGNGAQAAGPDLPPWVGGGAPVEAESLQWSPDGTRLLVCGDSASVWAWDAETGRLLRRVCAHDMPVVAACWLPDGHRFVAAGLDKCTTTHSVLGSAGDEPERFEGFRTQDMRVSADGQVMAALSTERSLHVLRPSGRGWREVFQAPVEGLGTSLALTRDGRYALVGTTQPSGWHLWDLMLQQRLRVLEGAVQNRFIARADFGPGGGLLVASGSEDTFVRVWDRDTGAEVAALSGHAGPVGAVAWNPAPGGGGGGGGGGAEAGPPRVLLATGSDDHTVRLWGAGPPDRAGGRGPAREGLSLGVTGAAAGGTGAAHGAEPPSPASPTAPTGALSAETIREALLPNYTARRAAAAAPPADASPFYRPASGARDAGGPRGRAAPPPPPAAPAVDPVLPPGYVESEIDRHQALLLEHLAMSMMHGAGPSWQYGSAPGSGGGGGGLPPI